MNYLQVNADSSEVMEESAIMCELDDFSAKGNADSSEVMEESAAICKKKDFTAKINAKLAEYKEKLAIAMKQPKTTRRPENMLHAPFKLPRPGTSIFRNAGRRKHCPVHGLFQSTPYRCRLSQCLCQCQPDLKIYVKEEEEEEPCTSSVLERDVGNISLT